MSKANNIWKCILLLLCITFNVAVGQQNVLDKVVAVVGNEALLESDLEQELLQLRMQGMQIDDEVRCNVFEQLLLQKLLLAQARLDSLTVSDFQVDQEVEHRIRIFTAQAGGTQELEKTFGKPLFQIKADMKHMLSERNLTQQMQGNIVKDVLVTPRDVQQYYQSMPADSFPMIPDQFIIQQIAKYPPSGGEARFLVREKLLELRERVMKGEKFSTLAVMYSEDPGSARRGGELGLSPRDQLAKPFADAAWALKPNQVSQIVETEYGYHIIQCIDIQGELRNLRHILIRPTFSTEMQLQVASTLDSVATLIRGDSLSFELGVLRYSEDKNTRLGGGYVVNPQTQSTRFDKDQLLPDDYFVLRDMKVGQVSNPFKSKDNSGNEVFKVIKLKELIPSHRATFISDYMVIHDMALNKRQQEVFDAWITKRMKTAIIVIDPDMQHCKFEREGWIKSGEAGK